MCGITGVISLKNKVDVDCLQRMAKKIDHRGPDGIGFDVFNEKVGLGHTRLSIFDLSEAGKQPMSYQDKLVITYNGEIYNFLELKAELNTFGHEFKTGTDTEVILASYQQWGVDCLKRFNGMWAFVIYDKVKDEVFIARDRFGQKPLYYTFYQDNFLFASEIKSFMEFEGYELEPNMDYLERFLNKGVCEWSSETAFNKVLRFEKAQYFQGKVDVLFEAFMPKTYWSIKNNLENKKFNKDEARKIADKYYGLLKDSVRIRCRADVEVGAALSGGLDSSSVVYLINEILKESNNQHLQKTFSSVYSQKETIECDESSHIKKVTSQVKVNSFTIEPQEKDVPEEHEKRIYVTENPPDGTGMSGWHTYKLINNSGIKISLDGQGADEQLAGYMFYVSDWLTYLSFFSLLKETYYGWKLYGLNKYIVKGFICSLLRQFLGVRLAKYIVEKYLKFVFPVKLNAGLERDFNESLVNLLHYADHSSMGNSIESRMPFMDYRLVEFLASVPACYKIHNGWTKYIARLAFDGKLDNSITWRKDKMGWPVPEKFWLLGGLRTWLEELVDGSDLVRKLLTPEAIRSFKDSEEIVMKLRMLNIAQFEKLFLNKK